MPASINSFDLPYDGRPAARYTIVDAIADIPAVPEGRGDCFVLLDGSDGYRDLYIDDPNNSGEWLIFHLIGGGTPDDGEVPIWSSSNNRFEYGAPPAGSGTWKEIVRVKTITSAPVAISNFGSYTLSWDAEHWDDNAHHDNTTNKDRLVIVDSGNYKLEVQLTVKPTTTTAFTNLDVELFKNGVTSLGAVKLLLSGQAAVGGDITHKFEFTAPSLVATDYLTVVVIPSGASTIVSSSTNFAALSIRG